MSRDQLFWPRSFLDELESYQLSSGAVLWFLGSPTFLFQTPQARVYIDPYFGPTPPEAAKLYPGVYRTTAVPLYPSEIELADAAVSTHDHTDHCHEPTLLALQDQTTAPFIAPENSAIRMLNAGIKRHRIRTVVPGDRLQVGDIEISVYGAYDPDSPGAVTFVFRTEASSLFVSGDTRAGEFLDQIASDHDLDLALLAFGGFYMSSEEMLAMAARLAPKVLLPFHWEVWRGTDGGFCRRVRRV